MYLLVIEAQSEHWIWIARVLGLFLDNLGRKICLYCYKQLLLLYYIVKNNKNLIPFFVGKI